MKTRLPRTFWSLPLLAMALLGSGCPPSKASPSPLADAAPDASTPSCISWRQEVRYRPYGWDHLVYIRNACTKNAICAVTTDVNPQTITVSVVSGTEVEVVTFQGSPSQTFTATVVCELAP